MTIGKQHSHEFKSRVHTLITLPNIIYIMGTGRSGTTILEVLLANNPDIFGVGEITHIFRDGYFNNATCSCGSLVSNCAHWSSVKRHCKWQDSDIANLNELFVDIAWHSHFPIVYIGLVSKYKHKLFSDTNDCLFKATALIAKSSTIVDSSKYAGRALQLARSFPDKVRIICLTRSPEGLINAFKKANIEEQKPKSLLGTFVYYIYSITCFRLVCWRLGSRVLHVRYEDLACNTLKALDEIGIWAGLNVSATKKILTENKYLSVGHIVTGNRLRHKKDVQFSPNNNRILLQGFLETKLSWFMNLYRKLLGF